MLTLLTFLIETESRSIHVTTRLNGACYIQLQIFCIHIGILRPESRVALIHRILTLDTLY